MALPPRDHSNLSPVSQLETESTKSIEPPSPLPAPTLTGPGRRLFDHQIARRFLSAALFCSLLVIVLSVFQSKGHLSVAEKRGFNTLTILLSSIVSLWLGSLLNLLGCMLRWRLLAWEKHKPRDVDMILGVPSPTGSLKLLWHHVKNRDARWTRTTWTVLLYLLVNLLGRFSIAALGLAYNLNETPYTEYPVKVPDWSSEAWYNAITDPNDDFPYIHDQSMKNLNAYAALALSTLADNFGSSNPSSYDMRNIGGRGLDRTVKGSNVTYSYALKEYRNSEELPPTGTVLRSSASCVGRSVIGDSVYEKGKHIGTWVNNGTNGPEPTTPVSFDIIHNLCLSLPRTLDVQDDINHITLWTVWEPDVQTPGSGYPPSGCSTSYFWRKETNLETPECDFCCATFYKCTTCVTDQEDRPVPNTVLFDQYPSPHSFIGAKRLLSFGALDQYVGGVVGNQSGVLFYKVYVEPDGGSGDNVTAGFVDDLWSGIMQDFSSGAIVPMAIEIAGEIHAAHLTARLPLLTVMGAEMQLPRVSKIKNETEHHVVRIVLDVKWERVGAVVGAIIVGQVLAIVATVLFCRGVLLHDHDSFFPIARLLNTAVNHSRARSVDTGVGIAAGMEAAGGRGGGDVGGGGIRKTFRKVGIDD
ncbi:hypothetical protein B0I37DRAFT_445466 [Chaetomium sp. MPI-CAGE-AT-0009]|nr:hypothetical protein B0I37DRAFT_445466 [Chaetomium sp. MPI-CAGE-AT-0009]